MHSRSSDPIPCTGWASSACADWPGDWAVWAVCPPHPWGSPFGPAAAGQNRSRRFGLSPGSSPGQAWRAPVRSGSPRFAITLRLQAQPAASFAGCSRLLSRRSPFSQPSAGPPLPSARRIIYPLGQRGTPAGDVYTNSSSPYRAYHKFVIRTVRKLRSLPFGYLQPWPPG